MSATGAATLELRAGAWNGDATLSLPCPSDWEVHRLDPDGAAAIDDAAVAGALAAPVASPPLRALAAGRRSAVIAVDDCTRPTPAARILAPLLAELEAAGVAPARTRILVGTAAHRPPTRDEIERKLGGEVARRFEVAVHDFVGPDVRRVGFIRGGPVELNRHFLDAELRVCVGGVIPHNETGFGGGAKMVVPGVAGRRTIAHFHGALPPRTAGRLEAAGALDRRAWSEAVAREVGVDFAACAVVNGRRELAGLFAGDVVEAHRAAARAALRAGRTPVPSDLLARIDVAIVNAYPLDSDPIQMGKSVVAARKLGARRSVLVNAASDGIFYHGMGMGSGVQPGRLLRNLPGWLADPRSLSSWLRGLACALPRPELLARVTYYHLNHRAYAAFAAGEGRRPPEAAVAMPSPERADPLVFSRGFPAWGFRARYRRGRLYRDWDALCGALAGQLERPVVALLPCAPLQLVEVV